MNKFTGVGPYLFAIAIAGFGITELINQDFLAGLLPVPAAVPGRQVFLYLSSAIFLLCAAGILLRIRQQLAAFVAGLLFTLFLLLVHLPKSLSNIYNGGIWAGTFEMVMLAAGAFMLAFFFPADSPSDIRRTRNLYILSIISRYLFAFSLVVFAYQHIIYFSYIVSLIPKWMPAPVFLAYIVIAAYILSAFSLFTGRKMGLATLWLGIMFLLWVILLHGPLVAAKPAFEPGWSSLFVALAMSGISLSMAGQWLSSRVPSFHPSTQIG